MTCPRLSLLIVFLSLFAVAPARAQFTPRTVDEPATGEKYHIEATIGLWNPATEMTITSEALGITGSTIDFKKDLGLLDGTFPEFHLALKASKRNKFRFELIPIKFDQESILLRDVIFQGIRYRLGVPVKSEMKWNAYRFGYQFDFISRSRGFAGFVIDVKYTDVYASLQSPIDNESLHARAPIPTVGGIGRVYIVPKVSITGEVTNFNIPDSVSENYKGHFLDLDLYGTVNFTNNVGANVGYRSFDLGYTVNKNNVKTDSGSFVMKGLYFGGVLRY